MGDADLVREVDHVVSAEIVNDALNDLDENLSNLHVELNDLQENTIRQLCLHMKIYMVIQCFVLSINLMLVPVVMALALSYVVEESQNPLNAVRDVLWFVATSLGAPLYIGSMWAMFNLPNPEELMDEDLSNMMMAGEFGLLGRLIRPISRSWLEESDENESVFEELGADEFPLYHQEDDNEEPSDKEDEADVEQTTTARIHKEPDLPPELSVVKGVAMPNSVRTSEVKKDSIDDDDDNMPIILPFQVDEVEPIVPEAVVDTVA